MIIDIHPPQVCPPPSPPGQLLQNNQKSSHVIACHRKSKWLDSDHSDLSAHSSPEHGRSRAEFTHDTPGRRLLVSRCTRPRLKIASANFSDLTLELRPPKSRTEFLTVIQDATLCYITGFAQYCYVSMRQVSRPHISLTAGISSAVCPPRPSPLPAKPENAPLRVDFLEETGTHYLKISGSMLGLLNTF